MTGFTSFRLWTSEKVDPTRGDALTMARAHGPYDLVLYAIGTEVYPLDRASALLTPSGTVGVSGSSVNDDEDVSYTAAAAGRHVLRVFLYRDQGTLPGNGSSVRLTHTPAPPPPMCAPDRLEESDTQALSVLSGTNKDFGTRCEMTNIHVWIPNK